MSASDGHVVFVLPHSRVVVAGVAFEGEAPCSGKLMGGAALGHDLKSKRIHLLGVADERFADPDADELVYLDKSFVLRAPIRVRQGERICVVTGLDVMHVGLAMRADPDVVRVRVNGA